MILIKSILLCCLLILKYLGEGFSKVLYLIEHSVISTIFGTRPSGETWREWQGGKSKGPPTLRSSTSLEIFCCASKGFL
jgi:hypothetical protein